MKTDRTTFTVILIYTICFASYGMSRRPPFAGKDWWQTAQFYQIYPRSFMDSNGDGIGDLNGITSKLEYLRDIGITAAWLSPIYKSPMIDFGYDITDFYSIQPEYGNLADFQALIAKANELDIKIILDFVPNHTSNESEWFQKSVKRESGYEDYYVWSDGKLDANGRRIPPSNWLSYFRGSAWQWHEERGQFYLHKFTVQQPDLNYRNPAVVAQIKDVMRYWLDKGVAGFRIDAVTELFEIIPDENGIYPDEELSGLSDDPDNRDYLQHVYGSDRPESIIMIFQWRQLLDEYKREHGGDTRVLLLEVYSTPEYTMKFYGNATAEAAHLPMNFYLIFDLVKGFTAPELKQAVDKWLTNMPVGSTPNWVIGNHDHRRAASRYGVENADAMNMLVMMLPGVSITYQGEELAMTDAEISWKDTIDPAACNSNENIFEEFTRDPSRTPFQWNAQKNAGFSTANKTWLPLADDYQTINVQTELQAKRSHLKIYQALIELRKTSRVLQYGNWHYAAIDENVFVLKRYIAGKDAIIYVANFAATSYKLDLRNFDEKLPKSLIVKIRNLQSTQVEGTRLQTKSITLAANEALILSTK